jgi:hypothetical protein
MAKIVNSSMKETVFQDEELSPYGIVSAYFDEQRLDNRQWETLSELIETMTGDAVTPFNTIGELIECIPDIVNYGEETAILCVFGADIRYYILGWGYEDNMSLWNKILKDYFPELEVMDD